MTLVMTPLALFVTVKCQIFFAQMECSKWSTTEVTISMTLEKGPEVYSLGPLVTIKNIECHSLSSDFPGIENVTRTTLSLNATVHLTQHFRWEKIKTIKKRGVKLTLVY